MGQVYRAHDAKLDRDVAIKILPDLFAQDAERMARLTREAQTLAALSHPNVVAVFDTGVHPASAGSGPPQVYIVMELLSGSTLRERLTAGALPVRKAVDIAVQVARGLGAAHAKGLIHRDLKPENIFLLDDGQVKILDFGLARQTAPADPGATQTFAATDPGTVLGTVGYMAPEQVRGQAVDARADLFALGAVLYEMVTGVRAFQRDTSADTMTAILTQDPPELAGSRPDVSPAIDRIIRHCLEKNANERFQNARDIAFALEALSGSQMSASAAHGTVAAASRRKIVSRVAIAGLVVTVGVAGVLAGRTLRLPAPPAPKFTARTFASQTAFNARFMPDGQTIIFSAAPTGNAPSLFEVRSDTFEAVPFGPPRTHLLAISSKGELAVLTNAHFISQRLFTGTLARMTREGAPRPWLDHVREVDWSPDGSTLALVRDVDGRDQLEYPIGHALFSTSGYVSDPRVSPDGARVAFMDHESRFDDRGWVKVVDQSGQVTTLAGEFWGEEGLAWSVDGRALFFGANDARSNETGDLSYQILTVSLDRPGVGVPAVTSPGNFLIHDIARDGRWLTTREDWTWGVVARGAGQSAERDVSWLNECWSPSLSRDGERILFTDGSAGSSYSVVWRNVDGSPIVRLGEGDAVALSPDGEWALAQLYSLAQLVIYPMGTREPIRLDKGPLERIRSAMWFPDSRNLLVMGNEKSKPTRAYRQRLAGGPPQPVLPEGVSPAAVSPDGGTILARDAGDNWRLYPVEGGTPKAAPGLDKADTVLRWSADGKSFFVRSEDGVPLRVDRVDLATGRRAPFREFAPPDRAGVLSVSPVIGDNPEHYAYGFTRRASTIFVVKGAGR